MAYQYRPLQIRGEYQREFRLLTLLPGQDNQPLRCEIKHCLLDDAPPYEALSYTWGNPKSDLSAATAELGDYTSTHGLTLGSGNESLRITHNLWCALRHLRSASESRIMWVDAICINQTDDIERSQQVSVMASIYQNASRVLAWLGVEDQFTQLAFDTIEEICWATKASVWKYCSQELKTPIDKIDHQDVIALSNSMMQPDHPADEYALVMDRIVDGFRHISDQMMVDLADFASTAFTSDRPFAMALIKDEDLLAPALNLTERVAALTETFDYRSYWRRLWILQELIHAKEVILTCGNRTLDLNVFWVVTLGLFPNECSPFPVLLKSLQADNIYARIQTAIVRTGYAAIKRYQPKMLLSDAMEDCSQSQCSDPRDKIFALLNICQPISIAIDYQTSVVTIYASATKKMIEQGQSLDVIFRKPRFKNYTSEHTNTTELPTWTPKFDQPLIGKVLGSAEGGRRTMYDAGGSTQPEEVLANTDPKMLLVRGHLVGVITRTTPIIPTYREPGNHEGIWSKVLELRSQLQLSSDEDDIVFWESMVVGCWSRRTHVLERLNIAPKGRAEFRATIKQGLEGEPSYFLLNLLRIVLFQKSFCLLEGGGFALVHGEPEVDDYVIVARGASAPFVIHPLFHSSDEYLRRSEETMLPFHDYFQKGRELGLRKGSAQYQLVGSAYLDGIMDGEVINIASKLGDEGQIINLV